jgi:uncharacterized protein (DUF2267 family)
MLEARSTNADGGAGEERDDSILGGEQMTWDQLDILDKSVEETRVWLNDLAAELGSDDRHYAFSVLRAFLHALRDHMPVDEVAQLSAQLPTFIRGVFYEAYRPSRTPEHARDIDSFLARVADEALLAGETEASFAASACARVLSRHISPGEAEDVLHVLPKHLRALLAEGQPTG